MQLILHRCMKFWWRSPCVQTSKLNQNPIRIPSPAPQKLWSLHPNLFLRLVLAGSQLDKNSQAMSIQVCLNIPFLNLNQCLVFPGLWRPTTAPTILTNILKKREIYYRTVKSSESRFRTRLGGFLCRISTWHSFTGYSIFLPPLLVFPTARSSQPPAPNPQILNDSL